MLIRQNLSDKVRSNCVLSYLGLLYDLPARMYIPPTHEQIRGKQKDSADCFEAYVAVVTVSLGTSDGQQCSLVNSQQGYAEMAKWLSEVLRPWVEAWWPETQRALKNRDAAMALPGRRDNIRIRQAKLNSIKPDGGMSAQEKDDSCPRCRLRDKLERMKSKKHRPY